MNRVESDLTTAEAFGRRRLRRLASGRPPTTLAGEVLVTLEPSVARLLTIYVQDVSQQQRELRRRLFLWRVLLAELNPRRAHVEALRRSEQAALSATEAA
jgi:hypothetical protein